MSPTALSSRLVIHSSALSSMLLNTPSIFFSPVIIFSPVLYSSCYSYLVLSYNFYLFVKVVSVIIHFSPKLGKHLYDHYFELLTSISLKFFMGFYLVLLCGIYSSISSFYLTSVCFLCVR